MQPYAAFQNAPQCSSITNVIALLDTSLLFTPLFSNYRMQVNYTKVCDFFLIAVGGLPTKPFRLNMKGMLCIAHLLLK